MRKHPSSPGSMAFMQKGVRAALALLFVMIGNTFLGSCSRLGDITRVRSGEGRIQESSLDSLPLLQRLQEALNDGIWSPSAKMGLVEVLSLAFAFDVRLEISTADKTELEELHIVDALQRSANDKVTRIRFLEPLGATPDLFHSEGPARGKPRLSTRDFSKLLKEARLEKFEAGFREHFIENAIERELQNFVTQVELTFHAPVTENHPGRVRIPEKCLGKKQCSVHSITTFGKLLALSRDNRTAGIHFDPKDMGYIQPAVSGSSGRRQ